MIAGTGHPNEYIRREPITVAAFMNSLFCLPEYYHFIESAYPPHRRRNNEWFIQQPAARAGAGGSAVQNIYA